MQNNSITISFETVADVRALMLDVTARLVRQGHFRAAMLAGKGILKASAIKERYDARSATGEVATLSLQTM